MTGARTVCSMIHATITISNHYDWVPVADYVGSSDRPGQIKTSILKKI